MPFRPFWSVMTLFVLLSVDGVSAAEEGKGKPGAKKSAAVSGLPTLSPALHAALQDQKYVAAIKLIDEALAKPKVKAADYLLYLKGRAQTELRIYPQALKTFTRLETDFPKSRWLARARFGRADVFVRQRDYKAAGKIYQSEAERLLSDGRQNELTAIYLEFADRYFDGVPAKGPTAEKKPNYAQALTYYQRALQLRS